MALARQPKDARYGGVTSADQVRIIAETLARLDQATETAIPAKVAWDLYRAAGYRDNLQFDEKIFAPLQKRLKRGGDHFDRLTGPKRIAWHKPAAPWTRAGTGEGADDYGLPVIPWHQEERYSLTAKAFESRPSEYLPPAAVRARRAMHATVTDRVGRKFNEPAAHLVSTNYNDALDQLAEALQKIGRLEATVADMAATQRQNARTINLLAVQAAERGMSGDSEEDQPPHRTN